MDINAINYEPIKLSSNKNQKYSKVSFRQASIDVKTVEPALRACANIKYGDVPQLAEKFVSDQMRTLKKVAEQFPNTFKIGAIANKPVPWWLILYKNKEEACLTSPVFYKGKSEINFFDLTVNEAVHRFIESRDCAIEEHADGIQQNNIERVKLIDELARLASKKFEFGYRENYIPNQEKHYGYRFQYTLIPWESYINGKDTEQIDKIANHETNPQNQKIKECIEPLLQQLEENIYNNNSNIHLVKKIDTMARSINCEDYYIENLVPRLARKYEKDFQYSMRPPKERMESIDIFRKLYPKELSF